jgi:predicted pyridoxine 5'-phosphate oxidase superfamily flavin-nucleotide-binding protein
MTDDRADLPGSTWHAGEVALQQSVGVAETMQSLGPRIVRDHMVEQHRTFYARLPFVVLGAVDRAGDVWATLRSGKPGFMRAEQPRRLHIDVPRDPGDPADSGMNDTDAIALLGIDLDMRRRLRLNGLVQRPDSDGFDLMIEQSFGNCPQYIQLREFAYSRDPNTLATEPPIYPTGLDERARALISGADTFFVASYVDLDDGRRQVDVSHRGGKPGFVRIDGEVLTIPDFAGNQFFNTLGNLLANPRAGLVFIDFASGDLLQISGKAEVILDSPEMDAFVGAQRLWRVTANHIVYRPGALPLRGALEPDGWSPNLSLTGSWPTVSGTKDSLYG